MKESKTIKVRECRNPHFKPLIKKDGIYPKDLLVGFELETLLSPATIDIYHNILLGEKFQHLSKIFYAKYDGSVADNRHWENHGVEINSQPFNWNWFLSNKYYFYDIGKFLKKTGSFCNRTCGFHVHICKSYFKERSHLNRFLFMFYKDPNTIARISNRARNEQLRTFADPWAFGNKATLRTVSESFNHGNSGEKYLAVNICHEKTVEVRIFQSTINPMLFTAYVEFCVAMAIYTKDSHNALIMRSFIDYVNKNSHKYPNLTATKLLTSYRSSYYKSDVSGIAKYKFWKEIVKTEVEAVKAVKVKSKSTKKYRLTPSRDYATV